MIKLNDPSLLTERAMIGGVWEEGAGIFGGVKQSGLGREGARRGLEDFQEPKYMCIAVASCFSD